MKKLKTLLASLVLISFTSAITLADGGETQGPSYPAPPPPAVPQSTSSEISSSPTLDVLVAAETVAAWLLTTTV